MAIIAQNELFSWENIETMPDIARIELVLHNLPDEELVRKLEEKRGKGRDDYPVRPMWNFVMAFMLTGHARWSQHIRELWRNRDLARACGFAPWKLLPQPWNVSRFLSNLLKEEEEIKKMFEKLVGTLMCLLPGFGRELAVDSKAIPSFANKTSDKMKADGAPDRRGEHDAAESEKKKLVEKSDGTVEETLFKYFGFKLHLAVDENYQLPVGYEVTRGLDGDSPHLVPLLGRIKESNEEVVERCGAVKTDKAYDSEENIVKLKDEYGIDLICPTRKQWKKEDGNALNEKGEELKLKLMPGKGKESLSYDQDGQVYCWRKDATSGESDHYPMTYKGYEADRESVKYVCPARACGIGCGHIAECPFANGQVRIKLETDRRIFVPLPRHTMKFERLYNKRTSVERVNGVLDTVFGLEWHTIRGLQMTNLRVGLALSSMLAMAVGRIHNGQEEHLCSIVRAA